MIQMYLIRFVVGGAVVSGFALVGDLLSRRALRDCSGRRLRLPWQRWA